MSQALKRINVSYSPVEDRLILSVETAGAADVKIWLTRRFTAHLWLGLVAVLKNFPDLQVDASDEVRDALLGMRHEEAVQDALVSKDRKPTPRSVSKTAQENLAVGVEFGTVENGIAPLMLKTPKQTMSINLDEKSLHAVCHMLIKVTRAAAWDLDLRVGDANLPVSGEKMH
jgi:hypothetical protein